MSRMTDDREKGGKGCQEKEITEQISQEDVKVKRCQEKDLSEKEMSRK